MTADEARALTREAKRRRVSGPSDGFETPRALPLPASTTVAAGPAKSQGRSLWQLRLGLLADDEE